MLTRIAVVPYPPLLVPELTGGAASRTAPVRDACLRAVSSLTDATAEWVAVGADHRGPNVFGPATSGSFAGFGVDVPVTLGGDRPVPQPDLPLPALVTGWLRERAGARRATVHLLAADTPAAEAAELGERIDSAGNAIGLLVLAEGSNRRDESSPHAPHPQAQDVDDRLRAALRDVDRRALLDLTPELCAEVGVHSRAAWQCAAGAASGGTWNGELVHSDTPRGVTYHVGIWSRTA